MRAVFNRKPTLRKCFAGKYNKKGNCTLPEAVKEKI